MQVGRTVRWMIFFVSVAGIALPAAAGDGRAAGQSFKGPEDGHFFFYVAPLRTVASDGGLLPDFHPGERLRLVHIGGGGEGALTDRFGIGTDFGGIPNVLHAGTVGVISVNAYYHPRGRQHTLDPYVTGGGSGVFSEPHQKTGGPNIGTGVNVWSHGEFGATVELRRTFGTSYRELRVGISVRQ